MSEADLVQEHFMRRFPRGQLAALSLAALALSIVMALAIFSTGALAGPKRKRVRSNPWGKVTAPATGPVRAIGGYSAGCIQGAVPLPMDGSGFQVMHPSRQRHFGHPLLVDFVQDLAKATHAEVGGVLLIGDLGQPRGGRALGGHASHQTGLDVDIWYWHPKRAAKEKLSNAEREQLRSRSVLNGKTKEIRKHWKKPVAAMLRAAGSDPRVSRIFVHPIIKRELCETTVGDRAWLRQIRPWYGHDDHFHVRLHCPKDSSDCEPQPAVAAGDGCGEDLAWWFDEQAQEDRKQARKKYQHKVVHGRKWPEACDAVLAAD